jgi:hypothetical protein
MLATVVGITDSFPAASASKSTLLELVTKSISWSIWFTVLGLLVGLLALSCHRYLTHRLDIIDHEMDAASLELVTQLAYCRARFAPMTTTDPLHDSGMFGDKALAELEKQAPLRGSMVFTGAALVAAWCVQVLVNFDNYFLQLRWVALNAGIWILFTFGVSCLAGYPVSIKFLHRRSGSLPLVGSVLCLCWNLAELVWTKLT